MNLSIGCRAIFAIGMISIGMEIPTQAASPTVVISVRSLDEILDDADTIGASVGQEGLKGVAEDNINGLTGGEGLTGLDRERPFGVYWKMQEDDPAGAGIFVAFLPISDEDEFETLVKKFIPDLKSEDGQWTMSFQGTPLFATFSEDYCFISTSKEGLTDLAAPAEIVDEDYDIAVELNLSSVPSTLKDNFLGAVEQSARKSEEDDVEPKSEAETLGRKLGLEWMLAATTAVAKDGDRLTFGLDFDGESSTMSVDLGLSAVPKSTLAKAFGVYSKTTPAFGAVVSDDAPLRAMMSLPTTAILADLDAMFDALQKSSDVEIEKDPKMKDDADKKAAKDVASRLLSIAKATLKSGSLHSVLFVEEGDEDTVRIIGGTKVAKGDDAGKLLDDILKLSKESPDLANVKPDVAKHAGARIHAITADAHDKQAALFGDNPVHLAIRTDSLWFSMGGGNLDALKSAIDSSGKKASKSDSPISIRVKPATLVTLMEKDDQELIQRAEAIAGESGDVLIFEIAPHEEIGVKAHLKFGIDLFKLSGK